MTQERATGAVPSNRIAIVGTGFVADLYLRSLRTLPQLAVVGAYDHDADRLATFCRHWNVPAATCLSELLADGPRAADLVLNLTNPNAHFDVTRQCLESGHHVYSEKPFVLSMPEAEQLWALA